MPLIRLADISELQGASLDMAESGRAQYGKLLDTWRAIMNKPDMFAAYLPFLRQVAGPGELDGQLKDACALYVGYLNHCRYTVSHRATSAAAKGLSVEDMSTIVAGDWDDLPARWRLALTFTRELTMNPATVSYHELPQAVTRETLTAVKEEFSDVELLELCMTIAMWNALARFHRVMDFDLDMPEAPEGVNPQ